MTVVATGGVASLFHGATAAIDPFDPDLTIRGSLEIYRRNTGIPSTSLTDFFERTQAIRYADVRSSRLSMIFLY